MCVYRIKCQGSKIYLNDQSDGLYTPEGVTVKRVKVVIPHDARLQDITTPAVEHE